MPAEHMREDCYVSFQEALANTWRGVALVMFGTGARDKMLLAEISVTSSISELVQAEDNTRKELEGIVQRVRIAQQQKNKSSMKDLLQRSMLLRTTLATIGVKRMGMQKQLETLRQSQLNQNMLQSMKHTSDALQTMGLKISDADNIMLDLEDSTSDINAFTKSMSYSFADNDITDLDLSKELELILSEDNLEPVLYKPKQQVAAAHTAAPTAHTAAAPEATEHDRQEVAVLEVAVQDVAAKEHSGEGATVQEASGSTQGVSAREEHAASALSQAVAPVSEEPSAQHGSASPRSSAEELAAAKSA